MKQKKVYVDLSAASSSKESVLRGDEEDEEEELELGLSLKVAGGKSKAGAWGDRCRILTAKDFLATPGSRASPPSSSSSVSSSSDDTKRVADPSASANQPSQMVVGWPPIRAFRMNSLVNQAKDNNTSDVDAITNKKNSHNLDSSSNNKNNINECVDNKNQEKHTASARSTRFVKVNMDGDPIGRKVNLNTHQSYETLAVTLEIMFYDPTTALCSSTYSTKASKLLDGSADYALTYEDKDGDWMLVGDVPWGMFLDTVKRLRIMRTSDANGLATRFQSSASGILRSKHA